MKLGPSQFLRFAGKAVACLIPIAAAWYFIAPAYNFLLAHAANLLAPAGYAITAEEYTIYVTPGPSTAGDWMYGINGMDLQYGLLITIALIAATPGLRLVQRAKLVPLVFGAMFVIHTVSVIVFAHVAPSGSPDDVGHNPFVVLFCILGCDLFPVLVWAALSLRHLLPRLKRTGAAATCVTP